MTASELLLLVQTIFDADAELTAWCMDQFGQAPKIVLGIDEKNPPSETDYPLVAIPGVVEIRGDSRRESQWDIFIGVGVVDDSKTVDGNKITLNGLLKAETLRGLAENALFRARVGDTETSGDAGTISYFPLFVSYSVVTVRTIKSTRKGLPNV